MFFQKYKELAGEIFDMSVIAVSSTEVDMLAVSIRIEGSSLVARPRFEGNARTAFKYSFCTSTAYVVQLANGLLAGSEKALWY